MNTEAQNENVSQETQHDDAEARFLQAWKDGVEIAGPSLFGCQAANPQSTTHWRQLTPRLDAIRRHGPNKSQAEGAFAAAMASFFNAAEGHRLLKKAGCESFGNLASILGRRDRAILGVLLANFRGW